MNIAEAVTWRKWPAGRFRALSGRVATPPFCGPACPSDRERCMCLPAPLFGFLTIARSFQKAPGAIPHSCELGNRQCRVRSTPRVSVCLSLSVVLSSYPLPRLEYPYQQRAVDLHQREQDYGYLSHHRHVVLGLDEVDHLTYTVGEVLGTRSPITCFLFPSLILDDNSSGARLAWSEHSSVLVCRPLGRTSSAHGTSCPLWLPTELVVRLQLGSRPHFVYPWRLVAPSQHSRLFIIIFFSSHAS